MYVKMGEGKELVCFDNILKVCTPVFRCPSYLEVAAMVLCYYLHELGKTIKVAFIWSVTCFARIMWVSGVGSTWGKPIGALEMTD